MWQPGVFLSIHERKIKLINGHCDDDSWINNKLGKKTSLFQGIEGSLS